MKYFFFDSASLVEMSSAALDDGLGKLPGFLAVLRVRKDFLCFVDDEHQRPQRLVLPGQLGGDLPVRDQVAGQLRQHIPTALLNRTIQDSVERRQPVSSLGHRLKFFYATQIREAPPTFLLFVNRNELFSDPYKKYLADQLRTAFGYEGCPIILLPRARPKTVESVRRRTPKQRHRPISKSRSRRGA